MSDRNILSLKSIQEAVVKIIEYASTYNDADDLYANSRDFDAILMNFVVIGEMVSRMDEAFQKIHSQVEWAKVKRFRNIIAHNYFGIDAEEVWQIIQKHIPELKNQIETILNQTKP